MLKRFSIFVGFILGVTGLLAIFGTPADILANVPSHYSAIAVLVLVGIILSLFFADRIDPEFGGSKKISRKITVGKSRSQVNYANEIGKAKNQVTVIGLSLPAFSSETVIESIRAQADAGVVFRIVLGNPYSKFFSFRRAKVYEAKMDSHTACLGTLAALSSIWKELSDVGKFNLEVYVQDTPPNIGVFKVDDRILWSPVLLAKTGAVSPYLVVSPSEPSFGDAIVGHINETLVYHARKLDLSLSIETQCNDKQDRLNSSHEQVPITDGP